MCTYICVPVYLYVCVYVYVCVYLYICVCLYMYISMYQYVYLHTPDASGRSEGADEGQKKKKKSRAAPLGLLCGVVPGQRTGGCVHLHIATSADISVYLCV